MGLIAMLPNHNPACRSELKLLIMKSFSIVETVKEASAVYRSFFDGVVIFHIINRMVKKVTITHEITKLTSAIMGRRRQWKLLNNGEPIIAYNQIFNGNIGEQVTILRRNKENKYKKKTSTYLPNFA